MVAALEERSTREVLDQNDAIDALKKEIEVLETEKARLSVEVRVLSTARTDVEVLHKEAEALKKKVEVAKSADYCR
jgi:predicted transcriptional regulator